MSKIFLSGGSINSNGQRKTFSLDTPSVLSIIKRNCVHKNLQTKKEHDSFENYETGGTG